MGLSAAVAAQFNNGMHLTAVSLRSTAAGDAKR